jgi:hypothetical protein
MAAATTGSDVSRSALLTSATAMGRVVLFGALAFVVVGVVTAAFYFLCR